MTGVAKLAPQWVDWLSVQDAALWPDRAGTGMTVTVDPAVMFDGHPTLRLDIPAGSSGTYRVGTTAEIAQPGTLLNWEGRRWLFAPIRTNNLAAVSGASVFFGDAAFSNFYVCGFGVSNFPEYNFRENEWLLSPGFPSLNAFSVGAGSPTFTGPKRLRVNLTVASSPLPTSVWIGTVGFLPQQRARVVITLDDGYAEHFTFVRPLAQSTRVPVSLSVSSGLANTGGYLTSAQIATMANDPFVAICNHAVLNESYSQRGLTNYVRDVNECRAFLRSLGVGESANHHAYVQSVWDNTLADTLRSNGYLSARAGISPSGSFVDAGLRFADAILYKLHGGVDLEAPLTLAQAQSAISAAITAQQTIFVIGHRFAASAGVDQWAEADMTALMNWLGGLQNQGLVDCLRWDQWHTSLTQPASIP